MLLIHEETEAYQSNECIGCMEDFSGYAGYTNMCESCEEMKCTTFKCPNCNIEHVFYGSSNPDYCKKCKILLPDVIDLKGSVEKRIGYCTAIMELFD